MDNVSRQLPILNSIYARYLADEDVAALMSSVSRWYMPSTLHRLASHPSFVTRRAAVLAIGLIGDFGSNDVLGRALGDGDRGVRLLADTGIRNVWCRAGNESQRQALGVVLRLNRSHQYSAATQQASDLIQQAPWFAEVWNQRAIAYFHLGQCELALADCRQALTLNAYHFGAACGMGQCHLRRGNVASALESLRLALHLNPSLERVRARITSLERVWDES